MRAAVATAMAMLARRDQGLVCIAGRNDLVATSFGEVAPERLIAISGTESRAVLAVGAASAGAPVIALLGPGATLVPPMTRLRAGASLLTFDAATARELWIAGWDVVVPAWPADVAGLMTSYMETSSSVVVLVHDEAVPSEPDEPVPPHVGRSRTIRSGNRGLVVASGATVTAVQVAARQLTGRGFAVRAVDVHTFPRARQVAVRRRDGAEPAVSLAVAPDELQGCLLVGTEARTDVDDPLELDRLRRVPVVRPDPREVVDAILGALPLRAMQ